MRPGCLLKGLSGPGDRPFHQCGTGRTARRAGRLPRLKEQPANDARTCAAALGQADRAFGQARPGAEPAWLGYFDEACLAARMDQCFRDLGHGAQAARFARRPLEMNQAYVRGRAFNLALLGAALAQQGQVEEACAAGVGVKAIGIASGLRFWRSIRYLLDLRRRLARYADQPQVRDQRAGGAAVSSTCCTAMIVAAPMISPLAIRPGISASGTQRTASASFGSGASARSAPRARYSSCGLSAVPANVSTCSMERARTRSPPPPPRAAAAGPSSPGST